MNESSAGSENPARSVFVERLNWLVDNVRPEPGKKYTNVAIASAIGVTPAYIGLLRTEEGNNLPNPTIQKVGRLADFFGVPHAYFLAEQKEAECIQHDILAARTPPREGSVAHRLTRLFKSVQPPGLHRSYTDEEVADEVGVKPYIVQGLRTGQIDDSDVPGATLKNIARFFGKPGTYLLVSDDLDEQRASADEDQAFMDLAREIHEGLIGVAMRTLESPQDADAINTGVQSQDTQRLLAELIRSVLERDRAMNEPSAPAATSSQPDEASP